MTIKYKKYSVFDRFFNMTSHKYCDPTTLKTYMNIYSLCDIIRCTNCGKIIHIVDY